MTFGFSNVFAIAALLYILAALCFVIWDAKQQSVG